MISQRRYERDIAETRLARDAEAASDLALIKSIATKWKELKEARR